MGYDKGEHHRDGQGTTGSYCDDMLGSGVRIYLQLFRDVLDPRIGVCVHGSIVPAVLTYSGMGRRVPDWFRGQFGFAVRTVADHHG